MEDITRETERAFVPRGERHLTVYVLWPLLGGLMLASVVAISVGGVMAIATLGDWAQAGVAAGITFFGALGLATAGVFVYAMLGWGGPQRIARLKRQTVIEEIHPPAPRPKTRWVAVNRPWRRLGDVIAGLLPSRIDAEIRSIEPDVDPEIKELFDFVTAVWPAGNVSRDYCRAKYGITRSLWEKMVGGVRGKEGLESGRGLLARAGLVMQDGNGRWRIAPGASLDKALTVTPELEAYAQARAEMVRL